MRSVLMTIAVGVLVLGCASNQRGIKGVSTETASVVKLEISDQRPAVATGGDERDGLASADVTYATRKDEAGPFVLVKFKPKETTPWWTQTKVNIAQRTFSNAIENVAIDVWNPGVPIHIVADATCPKGQFEIVFCPNDTVWEGWRTFKAPITGQNYQIPFDGAWQEVPIPLTLDYLLVIMRKKGMPYEIGLKNLKVVLSAEKEDVEPADPGDKK
jgi:hypothetical protein